MLIAALNLGTKVKDGKNQKTVLSPEEVARIEDTFIEQKVEDDFSVSVSNDDIKAKNYSLSAGQYFEVKIEYEYVRFGISHLKEASPRALHLSGPIY